MPNESMVKLEAPITVAQLLLKYLKLEGVDHLFGIPGGALLTLLNELKDQRDDFRYVICRQETGAAYMADGYARVSGGLGVLTVTSGPGATNALTGAMNAQYGRTPLLVITGEVPEKFFGKGYLQEGVDAKLNINSVYESAVSHTSIISSPCNAQTLIATALRNSLSVPGGVSHVSLPEDVSKSFLSVCDTPIYFPTTPENYRAVPRGTSPQEIRRAFELLLQAKRPLVFIGNGCRRALSTEGHLPDLLALVEKLAIPVMTTPEAKAVFPESHPMSLRNYGMSWCEWPQYYMKGNEVSPAYDALMIMGSSLGELATAKWTPALKPNGPLIQVDIDQAAIGRVYPVSLGIVADAGQVMKEMASLVCQAEIPVDLVRQRRTEVKFIKDEHSPYLNPQKRNSEGSPILPQALMKCINEALPPHANLFVDSGNCFGWAVHYLALDPPHTFHIALDMGPMGFAVGAVVGGKLAAPNRTCLAIVGDGAFMMQVGEVSTAARNGVGAIWVVLNDNELGMVSQGMAHFCPDPIDPGIWNELYELGAPDLAKVAEGLGASAYNCRTPQEARGALTTAIQEAQAHCKPQVIVAHVDKTQIPPYYQKPAE